MGRLRAQMELAMLPRQLALLAIALCLVSGTREHQAGLPSADSNDVDLTVPTEDDGAGIGDIEEELASPFHRIRHIEFSYQSREVPAESRMDCEDVCVQDGGCKSFSFRARDNKCLTSPYSLDYSAGWTLNLKAMAMSPVGLMKPTGQWTKFTGVKFADEGTNSARPTECDEKQCLDSCAAADECGAYSYNAESQECYTGSDNIKFDQDFSYYEKNAQSAPPEVREETASEEGQKLPETEEEVVKEKKKVALKDRLKVPTDTDLEQKLQTTALKIKQINEDFKNPQPQFDTDPKKEKAAKDLIRVNEAKVQEAAKEKRTVEEETYKVYSKTQQIEKEIRKTQERGKSQIEQMAKQAFNAGFSKAAEGGMVAFKEKKEQLEKEFSEESQGKGSPDFALAKAMQKAKEKREKKESLERYKAKARAAEVLNMRERHDEAIALSQKVSTLIGDEGASKAQLRTTAEKEQKDKQKRDSDELATKAGERGEKADEIMRAKASQGNQVAAFNLKRSQDTAAQVKQEMKLAEQEKAMKKEAQKRQENKQKAMEEVSGVRERGAKDEALAATKERASKQADLSASQEKISKLLKPSARQAL